MEHTSTILWILFYIVAGGATIFILTDKLEEYGNTIGKYLGIPLIVIASTFAAVATSGPEILISIITATDGYISSGWNALTLAEKATAGPLNMAFSAMDNLLGIGALALTVLLIQKNVTPNGIIKIPKAIKLGLLSYICISSVFSYSVWDGFLSVTESWVLAGVAAGYLLILIIFHKYFEDDEEDVPSNDRGKFSSFVGSSIMYIFVIWACIEMVKIILGATYNFATLGIVSLGGILLAITSYVSSFPELGMTWVLARKGKVSAILGVLFGSNVVDLGFAGLRPIVQGNQMEIFTTGPASWLLNYYILALPVLAMVILGLAVGGKLKYWMAVPGLIIYTCYVGFGLLFL